MPQSLATVYLHLVFSTKGRRPWFKDRELHISLHEYLGGISKNLECAPILIAGVEDHVHVLARFGRTISIAEWVKEMKRSSNIWLQQRGKEWSDFQWQGGYAVFSVSQSSLDRVRDYVARQDEHHRSMSFQDELRALFRKHHMEFDERYVWD